ncbi:MAG TPA: hypothetical protein VM869_32270, partial [Enhygromyxa sp.]|nr:hypothetical protein [Enhygromyxa sp.]
MRTALSFSIPLCAIIVLSACGDDLKEGTASDETAGSETATETNGEELGDLRGLRPAAVIG